MDTSEGQTVQVAEFVEDHCPQPATGDQSPKTVEPRAAFERHVWGRASSSDQPPPSISYLGDVKKPHSTTASSAFYRATHDTVEAPSRHFHLHQRRQRILFYHKYDPHYGFTNFSPHPVLYKNKRYPTAEHLFQSFKFQEHRPNLAEHIRTCSDWPSVAFSEAQRFQAEVRPDWKQVNVDKMDETLRCKFVQHANLRRELLATGDAELVEDSAKDVFWGIGADGSGRNELGKALERLREKLRKTSVTKSPSIPGTRIAGSIVLYTLQQHSVQYVYFPSLVSRLISPQHCHKKPKFGNFDYCGKTCAQAATPYRSRHTVASAVVHPIASVVLNGPHLTGHSSITPSSSVIRPIASLVINMPHISHDT
ncbi:hypothetical protein B0H21DRAFT_696072 [Amylocystis lapponica]|nr:hypothetical protein B0H21DRAFT_696072 [Amylocystis lapponica]